MNNKSLKRMTIEGFKWSYAGVFMQAFLQLIVLSILARLIPPEDFGIISISFIFINMAQLIAQIGIGPALIQKNELKNEHITSAFMFSIFTGILFYMLLFFSSHVISVFFENYKLDLVLKIVSINFLLISLFLIPLSILKKKMKFKKIALIDIISYFIGYGVLGMILALFGYGVWALVFASLMQNIIKLILVTFSNPVKIELKIYKKELFELLNYGSGFTIGRIFNYLALNGDNFIVGKKLGAFKLGIYSRVYSIISLPAIYFASVFDKVLFPAMSQIQSSNEKLKEIFLKGNEIVFFIGIFSSLFFFIFSEIIVKILLGNKWLAAIPVLKILSFAIPFRTAYKLSDALSRALGTVYKRAWRQAVYAFLVISGAYIGSFFDLKIIAFFMVFALFMNYILMILLSISTLKIKLFEILKVHFPAIIYFLFFFISNYIFQSVLSFFELNEILSSIILLLLLSLSSFAFILFLNFTNQFPALTWIVRKTNSKFFIKVLSISQ